MGKWKVGKCENGKWENGKMGKWENGKWETGKIKENGKIENRKIEKRKMWKWENGKGAGKWENGGALRNCLLGTNVIIRGLGLLPGAGGTQRLPQLVGLEAALPLLLTGKRLNAAKAKKIKLVDQIADPHALMEAALQGSLQICIWINVGMIIF